MKKILAILSFPALAILVFSTQGAWAHSQVISQNPAPSSEIAELPAFAEIVFNEKLITLGEGNELQVLDPVGNQVTTGDLTAAGSKLSRALSAATEPGEYYVSYRAVSADGHVVAGEYTFVLTGAVSTTVAPDIAQAPPAAEDESGELKFKVIIGLVLVVLIAGGFFFWRSRAKK